MKKRLFFVATLIGVIATAQKTEKRVGIETVDPTEVLHVEGTARITDLPANGTDKAIYTNSQGHSSNSKDQAFNATRTVVVDKNGVLGTVELLPQRINSEGERDIHIPIQKCATGKFSASIKSSDELLFKNYAFYTKQEKGDAKIYIKFIGEDKSLNYNNVEGRVMGGNGSVNRSTEVKSNEWTEFSSISIGDGSALNATIIVPVNSVTFDYSIRTVNKGSEGAFYSFCVKQMIF